MSEDVVDVDLQLPTMKVVSHLCKSCELCVNSCPKNCIVISDKFNELGYKYATYTGEGCSGCGICFYSCPEPGAIIVYKKKREKNDAKRTYKRQ